MSTIRAVRSLVERMRWDWLRASDPSVNIKDAIALRVGMYHCLHWLENIFSFCFMMSRFRNILLFLRSWWLIHIMEEAGSVWLTWSMKSLDPSSVLVVKYLCVNVWRDKIWHNSAKICGGNVKFTLIYPQFVTILALRIMSILCCQKASRIIQISDINLYTMYKKHPFW